MKPRGRDILGNTVLALLSLLLCAVLAEGVMRLYYVSKHRGIKTACLQADENLIYRMRPSSAQCSTNSQGYVDREHPLARQGAGRRIVVIGDSVASGQGVPFGSSFPMVLQDMLQQEGQGGEVIVLAAPGYSTCQEITLLRDEAPRYRPDLVIIAYHLNDPADPFFHKANGQVALHFQPPRSYAWFYLRRAVFRAASRIRSLRGRCAERPWCLWLHCVYWPEVEDSFSRIAAISGQQGVPVLMAFLPLLLEPDRRQGLDALYERLAALAARNHLSSIDLMAPFLDRDVTALRLPGDHWHPNAAGHRIIARELYGLLGRQDTRQQRKEQVSW